MNYGKIRAVVFDCDGVIIDSAADIAASVNACLRHFEMPLVDESKLVTFVGDGSKQLIVRAVNYSLRQLNERVAEVSLERINEIHSWYCDYYNQHAVVKTTLYPGMEKLLVELSEKGIKTAIVTNKPTATLKVILEYFGIDEYIDVPLGSNDLKHLKPNPEGLILAVERMNHRLHGAAKMNSGATGGRAAGGALSANDITPDEVLMVGDSGTDIECAKNYGCHSCGVTGGIGDKKKLADSKAEITVHYASDISKFI